MVEVKKRLYPKVSVIVPVYNAENYLSRCIDSILNQSFADFELIIIDDGSTDNSIDICKLYMRSDKRVKTIHKSNGGVSTARNRGIKEAKGEWVSFVDADDYVGKDYLKNLVKGIDGGGNQREMIWGSYYCNGKNRKDFLKRSFKKKEAAQFIIENDVMSLSGPVSKLFARELLQEGVCFPENIHMGEDGIFVQMYLNKTEIVSFTNEVDYYVNDTEGSLSKKYYSFEQEWQCFLRWNKLIEEYIEITGLDSHIYIPKVWQNRLGDTFLRCVISVAHQKPELTLKEQYKIIKRIPECKIDLFCYYIPKSINEKILKSLVIRKFFWLLLLVLRISLFKQKARRLIN